MLSDFIADYFNTGVSLQISSHRFPVMGVEGGRDHNPRAFTEKVMIGEHPGFRTSSSTVVMRCVAYVHPGKRCDQALVFEDSLQAYPGRFPVDRECMR